MPFVLFRFVFSASPSRKVAYRFISCDLFFKLMCAYRFMFIVVALPCGLSVVQSFCYRTCSVQYLITVSSHLIL